MPVGSYDVLLVLYIVDDSSLHLENAILMQRPHELLPSIDFILNIGKRGLKQIKPVLFAQIQLPQQLNYVLSDLNRLLADVVPGQEQDGKHQYDEVVDDAPRYPERVALSVVDAVVVGHLVLLARSIFSKI